mmetsp:Transcript_42207/g.99051  ORF Transcript_42207/g.99051 Transcript_42207/m.99051 type:complete len:223 (+) Transcript_42207:389-1057(+)
MEVTQDGMATAPQEAAEAKGTQQEQVDGTDWMSLILSGPLQVMPMAASNPAKATAKELAKPLGGPLPPRTKVVGPTPTMQARMEDPPGALVAAKESKTSGLIRRMESQEGKTPTQTRGGQMRSRWRHPTTPSRQRKQVGVRARVPKMLIGMVRSGQLKLITLRQRSHVARGAHKIHQLAAKASQSPNRLKKKILTTMRMSLRRPASSCRKISSPRKGLQISR